MTKIGGKEGRFPRKNDQDWVDEGDQSKDLLNNLYTGPAEDWLSEEEVEQESLKKLVESDALKAYAFLRNYFIKLSKPFKSVKIRPQQLIITGVIAGVIVLGFAAWKWLPIFNSEDPVVNEGQGVLALADASPDFDYLTSNTMAADSSSYDKTRKLIQFKDYIDGNEVVVTQQALPEDFSNNEGLQKLALSLQDKRSIDQIPTSANPLYLVETNNDTQIGIYSINEVLVFISSPVIIDSTHWVVYINRLSLDSL